MKRRSYGQEAKGSSHVVHRVADRGKTFERKRRGRFKRSRLGYPFENAVHDPLDIGPWRVM